MTEGSLTSIAICGLGLSAWMTAAALARDLPKTITITLVEKPESEAHDIFYGTVLPPSAYSFHLRCGLEEPDIILRTRSTFSLGTTYKDWADTGRTWTQCHHLPFPILNGIPFTHFIGARNNFSLEPFLISARAAVQGVFAHPPQDQQNPLSRAEYGYQVLPEELAKLYKTRALQQGVKVAPAPLKAANFSGEFIESLSLANAQNIEADLYIDATGPNTALRQTSKVAAPAQIVRAYSALIPSEAVGQPARHIESSEEGWTSRTTLRGDIHELKICDPSDDLQTTELQGSFQDLPLGRHKKAWTENCVAIGQSAARIDPLTPAPMMLLQRDIERLLTLIPVSKNMEIEAREYNRAFVADYDHALMFHQAFFSDIDVPSGTYWQRSQDAATGIKLKRKLTQFKNRGAMVMYDLEVFNEQDWAILHFGMGRHPRQDDIFTSLADPMMINNHLSGLQTGIETTLKKMPPHSIYLEKFVSYLNRKYNAHG